MKSKAAIMIWPDLESNAEPIAKPPILIISSPLQRRMNETEKELRTVQVGLSDR